MLAVLKAGGAFVPLDPSHPVERLRGLCESVRATMILCSRHHAEMLAGVGLATVLPVDDATINESEESTDIVPNDVTSSSNAAYVIFTSGSTGKPKGTVIEHRAFCSSARAHGPALLIDGTCRVLQFAAHTFDASLVEILTPLMVGACVCIPSEQDRLNYIVGAINRMKVDHAVLTPSFVGFISPSAVPGLRRLVLAGESMAASHVTTWSHIELVNGYGPAESSVAAVVNSRVGPDTDPKDIGMPCGVRCWLVDPSNHQRLVPVGCVGELLLEGPSLARGYLNDPAKTEDSFIVEQGRRFYKTGDLARYNSTSGSFTYVGRKDTQIKFHGQRIELGEIEHHLAIDESVQHALVLLPKAGVLVQRLIVVFSPSESALPPSYPWTQDIPLELIDDATLVDPIVDGIRTRLTSRLPAYMVPSTWLCVTGIPMLSSRKMDRKSVSTWVETILTSEQSHRIIMGSQSDMSLNTIVEKADTPLTETEAKLREIWSLVLNLPADQISIEDRGFLSLGGDSITAMTCANQAKKANLGLLVQDIIRSKSLRQLAALVKPFEKQDFNKNLDGDKEEESTINKRFDLSPIQQYHFQVRGEAEGDEHFNQSFCLRLAHCIDALSVRNAIETVVQRHAMLRARFEPSETTGKWQQYVTSDVSSSYRFRAHQGILSSLEGDANISSAQGCLNVRHGPLFAAELFASERDNGNQILFLTAHHLVIDLVSWRVILEDIEELLEHKPLTNDRSLSFRKWVGIQIDECAAQNLARALPSADQVPEAQFSYWGMENKPNLYGDVACKGFDIDSETTARLLSDRCHATFKTETVELLLAALIWSFGLTFTDRAAPAIFNEGHGREPFKPEVDISRTVGWFTTLFPVAFPTTDSFVGALVATKDLRRRVPGNGRPYFATRFHNNGGQAQWGPQHKDMEISFNFLGRYQQLERAGALFQPAAGALMAGEAHPGSPTADFGQAAHRFSLVEISAVIVKGALRFGFAWNCNMRHQEEIHHWIDQCRRTLVEAAATIPNLASKITSSDLALLPDLTSGDLEAFERTKLPLLSGGQGWEGIADIYPVSPIQQGLLMSRTKDGDFYAVRRVLRISPNCEDSGKTIDPDKLADAWRGVVKHHALLRTVFVDAISQSRAGGFDQVVLNSVEPSVLVRGCSDGENGLLELAKNLEPMQYQDFAPQHRLSIFHCQLEGATTVVCVLEMSHAIMDGASMDIVLRDLAKSYAGTLDQLPEPLFSPFVESLQRRDLDADIAFWTSNLAGVEPCHFPILNDGIGRSEDVKELHSLRVNFPRLPDLREFCQDTGITLPNAFHAAWALTLSIYTGSKDVCFGFLVSGRDGELFEGSEDAVGPFINMATQRVRVGEGEDLDAKLTLLDVLEAVQRDQIQCMPYAQTSLAEVQHALHLPGGMPLFNTCISYRRILPSTLQPSSGGAGPFSWEDLEPIHDPTEYPISVNIEVDNEGEAAIDIDYWSDSVVGAQAQNVAATFIQALTNIIESAGTPISELDNVHETSKELIWGWNSNMPATTVDCVHHMVEKQVSLRPKSLAVRGWDADLSYEEIDALANRLAAHLLDLGVGPEVFVPVCFDKSAWTVVAMLGVLKAGGGVVPLDATHPPDALEGKVADAGAYVVVASESRASIFDAMVPYVVAVSPDMLYSLPGGAEPISSGVSPEDPAFVMFTSGSTGKPKGVVLCHQALVSSSLAHGGALGLGPHTRFLQFAAHTFDNSLEEMFTNLIHGGCICVPSDAERLGDLAGAIGRLDANFMDLTPTVAALLRAEEVPSIRGMGVGGEALTQEVLDIWGGFIPVHNQYGPSECSINATHRLHSDARGDVGNIGTSVGSVSWIVDPSDHNRLMPIGCAGELLIEGPILARGYLGRPVETAKAFIEMPAWASLDPYHTSKGERRMYKTGDLVRYNSDGSLIYLGRKDTQVKLHGQRIELGEIEHHVKTHLPASAQSSVELVSPAHTQKALAAFICLVGDDDDKTSEEHVRILPLDAKFQTLAEATAAAVATKTASYMVPSLFIPVSRMPLTSSGKLDRKRLRSLAVGLPADSLATYRLGTKTGKGRAPETRMEKKLQTLWALVLSVEAGSISAEDSFFRHGGDSVGAMRLVSVGRRHGITLTVSDVFQAPKLSDMAKLAIGEREEASKTDVDLDETLSTDEPLPGPASPFSLLPTDTATNLQKLKETVASVCNVDLSSVEDIYPCTPLQAGLVASSQRQPGAYVAMNAYALPADTDITRFKMAWDDVAQSEAILRTRVVFLEGLGFLQVVVGGKMCWDTAESIEGLPQGYRQLPPHDGGVLCRYAIVGENTVQPVFVWTAHHALYDGWSLPTLLGRVEERYRQPQMAMAPTPHYSRFVEHLISVDVGDLDAFWTSKLSGSAPQQFPQLPSPGYRVKATGQTRRVVSFTRPPTTELMATSFLRAAWALVVSIYSSSDDVVFGEVLNGRDVRVPGVEDLVGPTLTSVPRRVHLDRSLELGQMLADLQTDFNRTIPYQFAGLQRIKSLNHATAAACDFQNLFVIDTADDVREDSLWSNLVSGGSQQGADFFSYPLNVTCTTGRKKQLEMCAYFDPGVVPEWQVVRMLGQFETVLQKLSSPEAQEQKVGEIDLLSSEDRATLQDWNRVGGPVVERRVHDVLLEQMAIRGPESTAVVGWDANLSTRELDLLSNVLAKELVLRGVGSNGSKFVPFCLEKSTFAVVALLAILKTGAAFVPLDPAHPVDRLKEIVGDCEATFILCTPKFKDMCSQVVAAVVPADMAVVRKLAEADKEGTASTEEPEIPQCDPSDPAYVIFTSGSTGKPKGTIVSHTAFCSGAAAHGPAMMMTPPFRFLQFASYTFDACLIEILTTLMMGGTVCVPRGEDRTNGNIAAVMEEMGVTMTLLTPSFVRVLKPSDVPSLKTLILGGEAMNQSHVETWAGKVNLINAYGPSECSVVATVNPCITNSSNPANLGRGIGRCWIVDPDNHNRLVPIGSVGELLIEGPTLSNGYLRNGAKTREVFIDNPQWSKDETLSYSDISSRTPRRMYKTGDLVRVCNDSLGEMIYMGRKDASQAKLNGQRLELDEIAHHLGNDGSIRHAVVLLPKSGPCHKRLVAVLSLRDFLANGNDNGRGGLEPVVSRDASAVVNDVEERLRSKLPPYMIPSVWVVLPDIPLLPSGKLNRNSLIAFVEDMSGETFDKITAAHSTSGSHQQGPATSSSDSLTVHERLRAIWGQALNLNPERIGGNVSFLHLGGDSITAMQVMARCRSQGITITVQDIINSKSVHDLALKVRVPKIDPQGNQVTGEDHHEFDPTPIQQLYFQQMAGKGTQSAGSSTTTQFNQSVLLRLMRHVDGHDFGRALHALVEAHSMLRARFRRDGTGNWRQRITSDVTSSYRFKTHVISNMSRIEKRIQSSQKALDFQKGPLLAIDWFSIGSNKEVCIFITAHHLIIDVVSWGILLQDLEDFLGTGSIKPPTSMPFQMWSRKQSEQAQVQQNGPSLLPHHETADSDLEYWGMTGVPNVHRDVVNTETLELETDTTSLLLGPDCHKPLSTDTLDILLAALLLSYRNATTGRRGAPTIYNEGHGREPWDDSIDLSRTVGWFTTLSPVHLPDESSFDNDIINAIRWVKDYRSRLAGKGRPYFAYRLLTSQGREEYQQQWPVEVAFNYLGQMQQLNRADSILRSFEHDGEQSANSLSDVGKDVPRLALIEVSAIVAAGKMKLSFAFNKHMEHQDSIMKWVKGCRQLLEEGVGRLIQRSPEKTLSEFPLLPLAYYGVENLSDRLKEVSLELGDIEDVYPCSPMQRGLLLSQIRDPEKYAYSAIFEVSSAKGAIDHDDLCAAWQSVVKRHATLRTIFVDTIGDEGLMDQVVLRDAPARIELLQCDDGQTAQPAVAVLQALRGMNYNEKRPPHRLAVCYSPNGRVFCRLEISHAICDGSSLPILLSDLADAYGQSDKGGTMSINKPLPMYRDFIAHMQSQPRGESVGYWKEYLDGSEPCLFPTIADGQAHEGESDTGPSLGSHIISIDYQHIAHINSYCADSGITLSTLLQFVWALVIRSYTDSDEVLFGYLASGRDVPVANIENAVGAFINMLVCRLSLSPDTEVGEALDTMRLDLANAMAHQSCSLAEMQHELRLPGSTLFNTAFTYQRRGRGDDSPSRSSLQYRVVTAEDPSEYAIAVNVEATENTIEIHFGHWRNVVSDAQIKNVAATFQQALLSLIDDRSDDRLVGEVELVGKSGIKQISSWNNYRLPCVERCVHDLIYEHVQQRPDMTPAVCGWDASFTYRELDIAANALAYNLLSEGISGPDVYVPLCFEKSAWTVVAQLAVLKAGGAFVNLDPAHPDSRLGQLIQDANAQVVLCSSNYKAKMDAIATKTVVVNSQSITSLIGQSAIASAVPFPSPARPSSAAYVIFTSGTTGKPKGTVIEHGAFCTGGLAHAKAMFMHSDSRVLQFASYTFDASVMETLSCLLVGGCVCVPSDEDRINDVGGVIRQMGVTWTLLTPSVASTVKPESVPCLKTLVTGGEAMSAGHIEKWGTRCALVNAYGPSECSVVTNASTKVDESHNVCNVDRSNIGPAVGGRIWVVDPRNYNVLVPVGAVGELVVEGRLVARGYLNNLEQTAKAFIRSPPKWMQCPSLPQSIKPTGDKVSMYRTGDLVRYNSDGSVSYVARKDTQVKINGRRIELGEIESNCRSGMPDDMDSQVAVEVVVVSGNRSSTKLLAVFFTYNHGNTSSSTSFSLLPMTESLRKVAFDLQVHLNSVLPTYMVPQLFVPVSVMPWTSAGKLDRRRLRQAIEENGSKEAISGYKLSVAVATVKRREPSTDMEKKLLGLWESVLGLSSSTIGAGDSFFGVGGDSLTAMRLVGAARAHRINLSVLTVFEKPVLADMALACGGDESAPVLSVEPPQPFTLAPCPEVELDALIHEISEQCKLSRAQIQDIYPCSPLQEGLVALANKQEGAYIAINTLPLPAGINQQRFQSAWQQVINQTDILRTRIVHTAKSGFLQVVSVPAPIEWIAKDSLHEVVAEGKAIGMQNGGELTRYMMVENEGCRQFVWAIHHALYDGWSLPLIARQVQATYKTLASQDSLATGVIDIGPSYANFVRYLVHRNIAASEKFWVDSLAGASSITHFPQLPTTAVTTQQDSRSFRAETCKLPIKQSDLGLDITRPTLVRAAWAILVSSYTGTEDVVFGETLSGRNIDVPGVMEMAGPTFTTIPTRVQLSRGVRLADFLKEMHNLATRVAPHQHLGLQHIKRLNRDCSGACDFQNLLTIQSSRLTQSESLNQGDEAPWEFHGGSSTEGFFTHPLVLECNIDDVSIQATMHYDEQVLSTWHTQNLVHQFEGVLRHLLDGLRVNGTTLGDIPATSTNDQFLISKWNRTHATVKAEVMVNSCIHELFLIQASDRANQIAISGWDAELTYGEVRDYASRLANRLQSLGVGPNVMVPVCLERSAWSVVILMGVLMAGGAFVPLDPAHPMARHKDILESILPSLILASPEHMSRYTAEVELCVSVDGTMIRSLPTSPQPVNFQASPSNTAYVLFTSGSTGRPKGVVVAHRDFCSSSRGYARATHMNTSSRVLHFASLTFDVALMEVLTPLTLGASVCVPTGDERLHNLSHAMARLKTSWAFLTPSVAQLLDPDVVCPALKTLVCGGEAMLAETVERWADRVELMNGYGPTEASVLAVVNPRVSVERDPGVIGRATSAARAWVIDPREGYEDRLSPMGAIGELAISGPLLARGYLNDAQKTAKAFLELPGWARWFNGQQTAPTRVYRTGDLVQYRPDGAIEFVGRRDGQVKINGQRIELGEIESRLSVDSRVRLALVVQPKLGPCKKQLVAIITLTSNSGGRNSNLDKSTGDAVSVVQDCTPVDGPPDQIVPVRRDLAQIQSRLADMLPHYMIPTMWIVLGTMPVVVSGKLDRVRVAKWVEGLDDETYQRISTNLGLSGEGDDEAQVTDLGKKLREIWARELHIAEDRIKYNQAFLSLGGDSITAMGVVSRARNAKISLSVPNVLRCKSILNLAQLAKVSSTSSPVPSEPIKETDEPFALSPIQILYFAMADRHSGDARFNQSFVVSVHGRIPLDDLRRAMDLVVERHSMLRSRFSRTKNGIWQQSTAKMGPTSYASLAHHHLGSPSDIHSIIAEAQTALSIEHGPIFRVDFFRIIGHDETIVSMVAHHLCVDMVSWRIIIQDLSLILETGSLSPQLPPSFHSWCSMQSEHSNRTEKEASLPFSETLFKPSYWGLSGHLTYGKTTTESFTLSEQMTNLALLDCHKTFRSEPTDLFLAAISHSFAANFKDRDAPTIHTEIHGREPLDGTDIDLSGTVGWFTAISPLVVPTYADGKQVDALDAVRRTKDIRRSIPENGRLYFARRCLSHLTESSYFPMEVLFNFLGSGVQKQDHADSAIIRPLDLEDEPGFVADVGSETRRLALFEISAIVVNNKLQFSFMYDPTLEKVRDIGKWIAACKVTLEQMIRGLVQHNAEPTLSDYSLLRPMTYDGLRRLTRTILPSVGIRSLSEIEDVYPCTPVQEGMLISQLRDKRAYIFHGIYSVRHHNPSHRPNPSRIGRAWQKVVDRHPALRTVFIDSVRRGAVFDQVVLSNVHCGVLLLSSSDEDAMDRLAEVSLKGNKRPQLPHQLAICTTDSGRMFMKLEINHAAVDGGSLAIILEELACGYFGALEAMPGPLYSNYVRYIRSLPAGADAEYWMRYLGGLQPCYFPKLTASSPGADKRILRSATLQFNRYVELRQLSSTTGTTLANIMHTAWAFVLRKYTGSEDVCFGYLTADRDAPVPDIDRTVGTLINMLCCRIRISREQRVEQVFGMAQEQHLQSLEFQRCSLARVQHELGMAGKPLYNTTISTQNHSGADETIEGDRILFEMEEAHDPSEYAVTVNIDTSKDCEGVVFRYWSDQMSDEQAHEMAQFMARVLECFISLPTQSVSQLDLDVSRRATIKRLLLADTPSTPSTTTCAASSEAASPSDLISPATTMWTSLDGPIPDKLSRSRASHVSSKEKLLALWTVLLNLPDDSINGDDSFFDLGGDSITAMKLVGEARDQGLALSVADVFRFPSLDAMVASISPSELDVVHEDEPTTNSKPDDLHGYERFSLLAATNVDAFLQTDIVPQTGVFRGGLSDVLPATDFQSLAVAGSLLKSRWMLNYFYLDGDGSLNLSRFKRACFRVVHDLDILRTVFVPSNGRFLQVVLRTLRPVFNVVDVEDESMDQVTKRIQLQDRGGDAGDDEVGASVLLGEPYVEFTVVRDQHSCRHRIILRISHGQYDGVCFPRILEAITTAYQSDKITRPPTFANYLRASAGALRTEHYQHWKKLLSGSTMTPIINRQGPNYRKSKLGSPASLQRTIQLPALGSSQITTATVIKAAWAYVLAQVSASPDVVFGHTVSGRNGAVHGVENMIGPCLNLLPVRVRFGGPNWTARQLLSQIQEQQVANMPHEVLGFREIIRHCTDWPDWTYFTSTVQHQNIDQSDHICVGDISYRVGCASPVDEDFADLSIFSQRTGDEKEDAYDISLTFTDGGPVPRDFAQRALDMLCEAARLFAANPDTLLPSPAELVRNPKQIPFDDMPSMVVESHLHNLTEPQLESLTALVTKSWRQVLSTAKTQQIDVKRSSFFSLGGDIVSLAQLAFIFDQEGFPTPKLEDLIDYPTVMGHVGVLSSKGGTGTTGLVLSAAAAVAARSQQEQQQDEDSSDGFVAPVGGIQRADSSLSKVVKMAKKFKLVKMKKGSKRNVEGEGVVPRATW
ncbi:putative peptide synthase [Podospora fimiseda]|uniref:Peptide synthase n=1 Tax=Podospora fimiseda TaxID=252190 RepID=A0AAN7BJ50_9PEZI|nr:putative peptide synthase [Podospora fimiseda]